MPWTGGEEVPLHQDPVTSKGKEYQGDKIEGIHCGDRAKFRSWLPQILTLSVVPLGFQAWSTAALETREGQRVASRMVQVYESVSNIFLSTDGTHFRQSVNVEWSPLMTQTVKSLPGMQETQV